MRTEGGGGGCEVYGTSLSSGQRARPPRRDPRQTGLVCGRRAARGIIRDLILGRRCTYHSLSLLLGGVPVNPRC